MVRYIPRKAGENTRYEFPQAVKHQHQLMCKMLRSDLVQLILITLSLSELIDLGNLAALFCIIYRVTRFPINSSVLF